MIYFWDTNLFIYLLQGEPPEADLVVTLREQMLSDGVELATSALTLGEVLVQPLRLGLTDTAASYRKMLTSIMLIPFDEPAAEEFARLRATESVTPPDAIQLACALTAGCTTFFTNDKGIQRLSATGITRRISIRSIQ